MAPTLGLLLAASASPVQPRLGDKGRDPAVLEAAVPVAEGKGYGTSGGGKRVVKAQGGTLLYVKKQPDTEAAAEQICHASEQRWVRKGPESTELEPAVRLGTRLGDRRGGLGESSPGNCERPNGRTDGRGIASGRVRGERERQAGRSPWPGSRLCRRLPQGKGRAGRAAPVPVLLHSSRSDPLEGLSCTHHPSSTAGEGEQEQLLLAEESSGGRGAQRSCAVLPEQPF